MPANNFDRLISDLNVGLDLLAEQRRSGPVGLAKAWPHADNMAHDAAEIRQPIADPRRNITAYRGMATEMAALTATVVETSVATRKAVAAARLDRLRAGMKTVMAKALGMFAEGRISGAQAREIEARANRLRQALGL